VAELRNIDEKFAECFGLAQAAKDATKKVMQLTDDEQQQSLLQKMHDEADETAKRCESALDAFDGRKTAITEKARETKREATDMMKTYLGDDSDDLDGFEFLIMAEAGELGHWEILKTMSEKAGEPALRDLVEFGVPVQERHFSAVRETALALAAEEDPLEEG